VSDGTESDSTKTRALSVHELSQFVFCRRAGVIAYESETEDQGVEGRSINLGYLPQYSLISIETVISRTVVILLLLVSLGVIALIIAAVAALNGNLQMFRIAQAILGVLLLGGFVDMAVLVVLLSRRRKALRTPPREPLFLGDGAYPIRWWELRAAGFSPRRFQDVVRDEQLNLKGRPWAILVRSTQCIPVFRMNGENEGVYPNHIVRVAGYCHLVEAATNYQSPYGIVLLPRRLDAMAIPYTSHLKSKLHDAIELARDALAQLPGSDEPSNKEICLNCPLGRIRRYVAGKSGTSYFGQELPPAGEKVRGVLWHTTCGDRFRWKPPTLVALKPDTTGDS
jgi:hypothetical protein